MIHCIGRTAPPSTTGPFIRKYIFPGAYVPSLSEVFAATERTGLTVADMEVLRLHYHYTLAAWRRKFAANRDAILALSDERFCRAWEYYLAAQSTSSFQNGTNMVFQILVSPQLAAVPIVRDVLIPGQAFPPLRGTSPMKGEEEKQHARLLLPLYGGGGEGRRGPARKMGQTACKPGSVYTPKGARRSFIWTGPCGTVLATNPDGSDRRWSYRKQASGASSLFGLAPGGACHAVPVARSAVGSYPTLSPLPTPALQRVGEKAVCFLWRYPWGRPRRVLPATISPWSPDFPRPLTEPRPPGRLAQPQNDDRAGAGQQRMRRRDPSPSDASGAGPILSRKERGI